MALRTENTDRADAQIAKLYSDLTRNYGLEIGERFLAALEKALAEECVHVEGGVRRALAPEGHRRHVDLYRLNVRGGGHWRVLYELLDNDRDGQIDLLRIFSVVNARGAGEDQ